MIYSNIKDGVLFISIEDYINDSTINNLINEIDYMLYDKGMVFYAFNFNDLDSIDCKFKNIFQSKLIEIFLKCGSVVIYGINKTCNKIFGSRKTDLYYVENVSDVFKFIKL